MKKYRLILLLLVWYQISYAQNDTTHIIQKPNVFEAIESSRISSENTKSGKTNFEHWSYSTKPHAIVGYLGSIFQGGFSNEKSSSNWHYDIGAIYRGKLINSKAYKLNIHAWVEHTNLLGGSAPKKFAKDLQMFSVTNASDASNASFSLEYLHIENFFFDGFWDVSVGKLEPLFYMTFADYSGWDKLTFFSKTTASDPVPDMDGAFGFYTELNFSDHISIGGQIIDDNPRNEYLDPANFFLNTSYAYQGFVRVSIPSQKKLYSSHVFDVYSYESSSEKSSGNGWIYVGNQGLTKRFILTMKLSNGQGRILSYNGAYSAGIVLLRPFNRAGEQFGAALQINELKEQYEYGIDSYYKFFLFEWITASVNTQLYYTKNKKLAFIPGVRVMMTY
ncbi:hypothetical protein KFE94_02950 [bacterium SCSIO 12643]|nr:hypothetical protein KFE94_02950 [bacterium SCSIO 12643]